jgi:predicted enzyme related to lactoylglutathione lyase
MRTTLSSLLAAIILCGCATNSRESRNAKSVEENKMEAVTGIGGVFFKAHDPKMMAAWYRDHLGINSKGGHADFTWREKDHPDETGHTAWSLFSEKSGYFPGPIMINYRVANLDKMLQQLQSGGVKVEKVEDYDYGRFAWITDPEGNRIELWEPKKK